MSNNNHNPRLLSDKDKDEHHPTLRSPRVNSKMMYISVVALFFVVLLVLALHLYARCVLRRRDRRRRAIIQQLSMGVAAPQIHTLQPPKKGLDPSVIATLPAFVYKKSGQPNDPGVECSVCLSGLEDGEMARVLTNCNHTFHEQCIDLWLNSNSTCPICRTEAEPQPPEAKAEVEKVEASAPPLMEETSEALEQSSKVGGSSSRLSSFRRMLSRERSERRMHCTGQDDGVEDLERQ